MRWRRMCRKMQQREGKRDGQVGLASGGSIRDFQLLALHFKKQPAPTLHRLACSPLQWTMQRLSASTVAQTRPNSPKPHEFSPRECQAICRQTYQRGLAYSVSHIGRPIILFQSFLKKRGLQPATGYIGADNSIEILFRRGKTLEVMSRAQSVWMPEAEFSNFGISAVEMHFWISSRPCEPHERAGALESLASRVSGSEKLQAGPH